MNSKNDLIFCAHLCSLPSFLLFSSLLLFLFPSLVLSPLSFSAGGVDFSDCNGNSNDLKFVPLSLSLSLSLSLPPLLFSLSLSLSLSVSLFLPLVSFV